MGGWRSSLGGPWVMVAQVAASVACTVAKYTVLLHVISHSLNFSWLTFTQIAKSNLHTYNDGSAHRQIQPPPASSSCDFSVSIFRDLHSHRSQNQKYTPTMMAVPTDKYSPLLLLLHVISYSLNFSWLTLTQVAIKRLNWSRFNADVPHRLPLSPLDLPNFDWRALHTNSSYLSPHTPETIIITLGQKKIYNGFSWLNIWTDMIPWIRTPLTWIS